MKICIFCGSLIKGGTERVVVNLIDYLVECGDEVTLITREKYSSDREFELNSGAVREVLCLTKEEDTGSRIGNIKARNRKLRGFWIKYQPDVILSFIGKCNFMAIESSKGLGIPVVVAVRALPELEYDSFIMRKRAAILFPKAAACVFQTHDQSLFFGSKVQKKAVYLKNPVGEAFFGEPYTGEREKTIVTVGRIDSNKNHRLLIDAFKGIAESNPDWKVIIYGDGELRDELLEYVKDCGLEGRVELPGAVSCVADKIKIASVFVLPSNTEGSPNSLIEAMLLGLPVISTDCPCGGPKEIIENGINGLLIPVGDVQKMQESLQNLINNLHLQKRIASEAIKLRESFNRETVLKEWRDSLESIVNTEKQIR